MFRSEILLAESNVRKVHRKAVVSDKLGKFCLFVIVEARQYRNFCRNFIDSFQGLRLVEFRFARLHRIDHVFLDCSKIVLGNRTVKRINLRSPDQWPLACRNNLNALCSRIRALVKLARQVFDSKYGSTGKIRFLIHIVKLRLRKNRTDRLTEQFFADILRIIAVQKPDAPNSPDA